MRLPTRDQTDDLLAAQYGVGATDVDDHEIDRLRIELRAAKETIERKCSVIAALLNEGRALRESARLAEKGHCEKRRLSFLFGAITMGVIVVAMGAW